VPPSAAPAERLIQAADAALYAAKQAGRARLICQQLA
jgi:PleD family two-component response regulator